jgi:hypothetical protein
METELEQAEPIITPVPESQPREIWVRYKFKEAEFEGRGSVEDIKPHVMTFLAIATNGNPSLLTANATEKTVVLEESDKPLSANNGLSEKSIANGSENHSTANLLTFYLKYGWDATTEKSILSQPNQLLLIGYYLTTYQNVELLHSEVYRQAYAELAEVPVTEPANITARLNTLISQEYMLRKANDSYVVTYKGKNAAQRLIAGEKVE